MASACQICDEGYNKSSRKKVTCSYCSEDMCTSCAQRFLLEMATEAACMFCKKAWTREFLDSNFTKTWIKGEYVKRREHVLLEREKSMLPATQHLVENELTQRVLKKDIASINTEMKVLMQQLDEKKQQLQTKKRELYILSNAEETGQERREFTRACPVDGCRGFLSTQWKCGICKVNVCAKCHEIKAGEHPLNAHTCNPAILASIQALEKDSKPCPKCSAMIHKVSGCDQMWCTACKTAFSWRTGRIVTTGQIHNPHYVAWRSEHGDPVERRGGCNEREVPEIPYALKKALPDDVYGRLKQARRALIHIFDVDMRALTFGQHIEQDNIDLRIRYMLKEIDEQEWKVLLQRREKRVAKETDLRMLYEMLYETGRDIFRHIARSKTGDKISDLEALRLYYNTELLRISSRYACKVHPLNENWDV